MQYEEGKNRFIETWGKMASNWGISKSMAMVHALLLISHEPVCADCVMEELKLSRGSVNTNLHALMDWGLVYKKLVPGDRKDYYYAEKDTWTIFRQILIQRKKKELQPLLQTLNEIESINCACDKSKEFGKVVKSLKHVTTTADQTLDMLVKSEDNWFENPFFRMMK